MKTWGGTLLTIFGTISMVICLVMFNIAIGALDDQLTTAATYTEMTSLTDVMGIFGMVIFILFMSLGLSSLVGGTYVNIKKALGGDWLSIAMSGISGGITIVIATVMNGIILAQLHTAYTTVNATVNKASLVGLLDIIGIWGIVIFVALMLSAGSQIVGSGVGAFKRVKAGAF